MSSVYLVHEECMAGVLGVFATRAEAEAHAAREQAEVEALYEGSEDPRDEEYLAHLRSQASAFYVTEWLVGETRDLMLKRVGESLHWLP